MKRSIFIPVQHAGLRVRKHALMLTVALFTAAFGLVSCSDDNDDNGTTVEEENYVEQKLQGMTLHEKICQMIFERPEAFIDVNDSGYVLSPKDHAVTSWSSTAQSIYDKYPVGGIALFAHNIVDEAQLIAFNSTLHGLDGNPMLCVDEEGGRVARIANNDAFGLTKYESTYSLGSEGDYDKVWNAAIYIGSYVKKYGFDVDFAPVADVWTNPENTVIGKRAFSTNPDTVAMCAWTFYSGLASQDILGCYKHFPGHGDTKADTHYGYADTYKTWEEMLACEMKSFKYGIDHGIQMIMTAHVRTPNVTSDSLPATLSKEMLTDKLRGELGYQGLICTDGLEMGAVSNQYTVEEVAVKTVQAGIDIILLPVSLPRTVAALEKAVANGEITESRIDESVRRILWMKRSMGLI